MRDQHPRLFPSRDALTRFLTGGRQPRPVDEVATLIGWARARVKHQARVDEGLVDGRYVEWQVAARWLFDAYPIRSVFEALGPDTQLLPRGLQLLTVQWQLPAYVVHALTIQARLQPLPHRVTPPAELTDYLWDVLHRAIDPGTVARLRADREFIAAYEFPDGDVDG